MTTSRTEFASGVFATSGGRSLADDVTWRLESAADLVDVQDERATAAALAILRRAKAADAPVQTRIATIPWWQESPTVLLCDEFLAPGELSELQRYVLANKDQFAPATLVDASEGRTFVDRTFRRSETLFVLDPFRSLFEARVRLYLDFVCARLGCPFFERPTFELQLTATRNGGFFREHDDNSHVGNSTRRLTFVYYFFFEPLRRSGGALRFAPRNPQSPLFEVLPFQNRMVFFDSTLRHEVRPFVSESDEFEAARFTVNGWVHQDTWP